MSVGYTIVNVPITAQSATYWSQTDVGSASDVMTNYYYGQPSYNYNPDGYVDAGYHSVMWDGIDNNGKVVAAGIYFYSLQSETSNMTRKMVYMK